MKFRKGNVLGLFVAMLLVLASYVPVFATDVIQIEAKALTDHGCNTSEWHFVITQIDEESNAPGSIDVTWANGNSASVPLDKFTGGVAHYSTTANLDSTVTSATAMIYSSWSGEFNLSHGPCKPQPTETPVVTETPVETETPTETPVVTETPVDSTPTPAPQSTGAGDSTVPWTMPLRLLGIGFGLFFVLRMFKI